MSFGIIMSAYFYAINAIGFIWLSLTGLLMLFKSELGISGNEAKINLKAIHTIGGYVVTINLLYRLLWACFGKKFSTWSAFIFLPRDIKPLKSYINKLKRRKFTKLSRTPPSAKLAITFCLICLTVLVITGLIRAGTDIYYPPFGSSVQEFLAKPHVQPESLQPYNPTGVDSKKSQQLKQLKKPMGVIHYWASWVLIGWFLLHIAAVISYERYDQGNLISAMVHGKKILSKNQKMIIKRLSMHKRY